MCDGSEIDPDNVRGGTTLQQLVEISGRPDLFLQQSGGCSGALQLAASGSSWTDANIYNYSVSK
jgi:hypothetical protein